MSKDILSAHCLFHPSRFALGSALSRQRAPRCFKLAKSSSTFASDRFTSTTADCPGCRANGSLPTPKLPPVFRLNGSGHPTPSTKNTIASCQRSVCKMPSSDGMDCYPQRRQTHPSTARDTHSYSRFSKSASRNPVSMIRRAAGAWLLYLCDVR